MADPTHGAALAPLRPAAWRAMAGLTVAALLLPVLAVRVPPLTDYPDHLARSWFLAFADSHPAMQRIFSAHWALIPNLAMDLIVPPLMQAIPPLDAGRVAVALAAVLPATGAAALNRALFHRSVWNFAAALGAYNALLLFGFINFEIGVGVALWGAAAWVALAPRRRAAATALGAAFALAAFTCHIFGYAFFALLIGSWELAGLARGRPRQAVRRAACLALAVALPAALYGMTALASNGGPVEWQTPVRKIFYLLIPVLGFGRALTVGLALAIAAVIASWAARRRLAAAPMGWVALPALLLAYLALPHAAKGGAWIDARIPVLLWFTLVAVISPRARRLHGAAGLTILAGVFAVRIGVVTVNWVRAQPDIAAVRAALGPVTPGSRVLLAEADLDQAALDAMPGSRVVELGMPPAYWHYSAFAFIDHDAFFADAFTIPGQQPLVARPPYDRSGDGSARPYTIAELAAVLRGQPPPGLPRPAFLDDWPNRFDYLLLLNAQAEPALRTRLPRHLTLLTDEGFAAVYAIRP